MDVVTEVSGVRYRADLSVAHDISIPVSFGTTGQVSVFGGPKARADVYKSGDFTGSVAAGGSCNCAYYTFSPHLNGTHTECVGHITAAARGMEDMAIAPLLPARLVTLPDEAAASCEENYASGYEAGDRVLTRKALQACFGESLNVSALIVRTLPNTQEKGFRDYGRNPPPFLTNDAMTYIAGTGISHLLLDTPSADKLNDGGRLSNHRIFWAERPDRTITELVHAGDAIPDGLYFLNLQVAAFTADAAPSRPVLYRAVKA